MILWSPDIIQERIDPFALFPGNFGAIVTSWVYKVNLAVSIVPLHLTNYIGFDRYVTERRGRVVQYKNRRSDYPAKFVSS